MSRAVVTCGTLRVRKDPLALFRQVRTNRDGIAVTEFGFVAPIFLLMLMGIFDTGYAIYIQAVLQGATQEGARRASLENTLWTEIVADVNKKVRNVIPSSDPSTEISFTLDPDYYQNYSDIQLPEDFTDKARNGVKDGIWQEDEYFVDRNNTNYWESDVGLDGRGGAQDVVSIKASLTYRRIFPFWRMVGQSQNQVLSATTFLRNQPFSAQATRVGVKKCFLGPTQCD